MSKLERFRYGPDIVYQSGTISIAKRLYRSPCRKQDPKPHEDSSRKISEHYQQKMALHAVERGNIEEAVGRIDKLCDAGLKPDQASFDALVTLMASSGQWQRAEEWYNRPETPAFFPAFIGLQPGKQPLNALVVALADAGNLPQAEKYARTRESELDARSYTALVRACLAKGEDKRGHQWCNAQVDAGFQKLNKDVMAKLVCQLADSGNTCAADQWLSYMADKRVPLDARTYDYIRRLHPKEIVPTDLSGEVGHPAAPLFLPANVGTWGTSRGREGALQLDEERQQGLATSITSEMSPDVAQASCETDMITTGRCNSEVMKRRPRGSPGRRIPAMQRSKTPRSKTVERWLREVGAPDTGLSIEDLEKKDKLEHFAKLLL